jgi:hypothetical protein
MAVHRDLLILHIKPDNPAQHEPINIPSSLNEKASIVIYTNY